jgi:hypothetical protein
MLFSERIKKQRPGYENKKKTIHTFHVILYMKDRLFIVLIGLANTVRSESRCALRIRYIDLVVSIEFAVEVCCCFTKFSG